MTLRCNKVLVTGGSKGIGYEIAKKLLENGAKVTITGRNIKTLEEAAEKLYPNKPFIIAYDVRDISCHKEMIAEAAKLMDGIDSFVNNAGILPPYDMEWGFGVLNLTEDIWDNVISTNLKAVFFMMQAACNYMIKNNIKGNILNVSSEAGFVRATGSYGVSKTGVVALTKGWGKLMAQKGIVINGIAPGTTATTMVDIEREVSLKRQPNGRLAKPQEIAELAVFLMSKEGENIIGQSVLSDGGSSL